VVAELLKRIESLERIVAMQVSLLASKDAEIARLNEVIRRQNEIMLRQEETIRAQAETIKTLTAKVAKLEARLNTNSSNSSKPPSTDPPWKEPKNRPNGVKGKKGAQHGHVGVAREMVPAEEVDEIIQCKPADSCMCGGVVRVDESQYERKQVFEIPRMEPHVTEFQVFNGCCIQCSAKLRGSLPVGTPPGMLGPNALATIGLLTGKFHLSKRDVEEFFSDYFGLPICVGSVSNAEQQVSEALKSPYEEVAMKVKAEAVVAGDETSHKVAGKRAWIWVLLSSTVAVFYARASRSKKVALEILGENFSGILISDRYPAYLWVSHRQLCWAHLIRDFNKLVDAKGLAAEFANPVLEYIKQMFSLWHQFKRGEISRLQLQEQTRPICAEIERRLELGKTVPLAEALCKSLSDLKTSLWTFIQHEGVEPTNNEAERTVRQWVIWRKTSFGTQTQKGNEFVERILTAVATCKRQNRSFYQYLTDAMTAHLRGEPAPSFLVTPAA
jgi:transposase